MVKLNKIYTRTGDGGRTKLGDGSDVPKHHLRVEAYGTVDEANAALGAAIATTPDSAGAVEIAIRDLLASVQHDLFDAGADLCVPCRPDEKPDEALRITAQQTERIEKAIDRHNEALEPLTSFVLPGGTPLSAHLHIARTVVRRAERLVARLIEVERDTTNPESLRYLNRLSDLLFVLSRVANHGSGRSGGSGGGGGDVLWKPGANREPSP